MVGGVQVSWELLSRRTRQHLARSSGWIVAGAVGPLLIACWAILTPFDLRAGYNDFRRAALLLCCWYVVFAIVYAVFQWLRPARADADTELRQAPLSALQFFLHRAADVCAVPLVCALLTLPLYGVLLVYFGDAYTSGSQGTLYSLRPDWDYASFPNPWGWRVFFVGLNLTAATLLPLSLAVLLREVVTWVSLRIPLLIALPVALWYVVERAEYELLRRPYRVTSGVDPWPFIAILLIVLALPFALGWIRPRLRLAAGLLLLLVVAGAAVLAVREGDLGYAGRLTGPIRDLLGDARFALAFFFGHLGLDTNIELLLTRYQSAVLLKPLLGGGAAASRLAIWVGAGIYPPAVAVLSFLSFTLGMALRRRHPLE